MNWYKSLSVQQRINLKECCVLIVGASWEQLGLFFNMRERIEILETKLKMEGLLQ